MYILGQKMVFFWHFHKLFSQISTKNIWKCCSNTCLNYLGRIMYECNINYLSNRSFHGKLRLRGCKGKSSIAAEIFLSKVFELSAYKCSHFQVAYLANSILLLVQYNYYNTAGRHFGLLAFKRGGGCSRVRFAVGLALKL